MTTRASSSWKSKVAKSPMIFATETNQMIEKSKIQLMVKMISLKIGDSVEAEMPSVRSEEALEKSISDETKKMHFFVL